MRARFLVFMAALAGCGGTVENEYTISCLTFTSAVDLDPSVLTQNVKLASRVLQPVLGGSNFCDIFHGTSIEIQDAPTVACSESGGCWGKDDLLGHIWLSQSGRAMVHELLHVWDVKHLAFGTLKHENWDKNGYNDIDAEFTSFAQCPVIAKESLYN